MGDKTELELRIKLCQVALDWLRSDDPYLKEPGNGELVPGAIEVYTAQLQALKEKREKLLAAEPVKVGLGTAKLTPKVIRRE